MATAAQIDAMEQAPMLFNVVVHNQEYPAGAIRGQLDKKPVLCALGPAFCQG